MYIKRGAWKKAASITIQMDILILEWGISNLIGFRSLRLNRLCRNRMEVLQRDICWEHIGVGLTKCIQETKGP